MNTRAEPVIIQGGMAVAVSAWQLAKAVSLTGQLGVVSGTGLDTILLRRLQMGDPGGHLRRALAAFPFPEMAQQIVNRYFIPGGKSPDEPFAATQRPSLDPDRPQLELIVAANFVEVFLAKEGHGGVVGINYLEKIQFPTLPSVFGAMLAGVDYVLMGAGIPQSIPGTLDQLSQGEAVELPLTVVGAGKGEKFVTRFDPTDFTGGELLWLERPKFLAIIASSTLATMLARKANGRVDGFVVEGPTAGGHNAPPRGETKLNQRGEPVYGERDVVRIEAIRSLGRPFWLAGSYGSPERVAEALGAGAAGVQVGTAFAFCDESGLRDDIKQRVIQMSRDDQLDVFTDAVASPTGFPFKVLRLDESLSDSSVYESRQRCCDLGSLSQIYRKQDGTVGWRCPADRREVYVQKGGDPNDTMGRKCLCNCLLANVGLGQVRRNGVQEMPMVTCGDDVNIIARFAAASNSAIWSASDVIEYLLSAVDAGHLVGS